MAASSKAQSLNDIQNTLAKRYAPGPKVGRLSVLESVIYAICHEGATREQANQALSRFKDQFFDWNEVRVSSVEEIELTLAGLPEADLKAQRVRKFLRQLFSRTFKFELDYLLKKAQKEALKKLHEFEPLRSDYVVAMIILQGLGGHALPVDAPMLRCLRRLGVVPDRTDEAAARAAVERAVPKNRVAEFVDLLEELAHDTCVAEEPECVRCALQKLCPTGKIRVQTKAAGAKSKAKALPAPAAKVSKSTKSAPVKSNPLPPARAARKTPRPK
jgi:endonuclease III